MGRGVCREQAIKQMSPMLIIGEYRGRIHEKKSIHPCRSVCVSMCVCVRECKRGQGERKREQAMLYRYISQRVGAE